MNRPPEKLSRTRKRVHVKRAIVSWINEQGLKEGDCLLGQTRLATMLGTTPLTIHRAMSELSDEGIVHRRKGVGTFVGGEPVERKIRSLALVLPGERLDSPTHNPTHWPYIHDLVAAFLGAVGEDWQFSSVVIREETPPEQAVERLRSFDAVFFHHSKAPVNLWRYVTRSTDIPTVAFGASEPDVPCLTLCESSWQRTRAAVGYLVRKGYRRIMPVCRMPWDERWLQGFSMAMTDHGLACDVEPVRVGSSREDVLDAINQRVERGLDCDVILADTDLTALDCIEVLRKHGISVPGEVGVMGQSGLQMALNFPPFLTSVESAYPEMIAYALRELDAADGGPLPDRNVDFCGNVVPGRTTR